MKPVERITWFEARLFIDVINSLPETQKAGLRFFIPSSEEWSYACYGTRDSAEQYKVSKTDLDAKGWFEINSNGRTHEVGLKEPNAFGLYDMLGNVFEYSRDTRERLGGWSRDLSYVPCGGSYESAVNWKDGDRECAAEERYADVGLRLFAVQKP
jgi:formylglycine-generating enzyme required for sulfatase activity